MEKTLPVRCIGNSPALRIVDFFLDNRLFDYSKSEIQENLDMGRATFFKYWKDLERFGIVGVTRQIGKSKLYRLNEKNEIVKRLMALDSALCKQAMGKAVKEPRKTEGHSSLIVSSGSKLSDWHFNYDLPPPDKYIQTHSRQHSK